MKQGKIFLVGNEGDRLIPMVETGYTTEDVLQVLLAQYPDLLAGDQINPEAPRRWLLVSREMGVPGAEYETGRWSLDHLFLDQDGIPTFVECKRATDTRGRREVVAQMLDYAANGVEYWGMDRLRQAAAETAKVQGKLLDEEIQALLDGDEEADIEAYWTAVEANLEHGRVRLIFVADETPAELRRLVEFLNEKMQDVEVLAVEVKQYLGHEQRALVPRVVGLTELARRTKRAAPVRHTNQDEFLSKLPPDAVPLFAQILREAGEAGHTIYWGTKGYSLRAFLQGEQRLISFMYGWPEGVVDFYFGQLPIPHEEAAELRERLMAYGIFRPSGEKTLKAPVSSVPPEKVLEMFHFVLEVMRTVTERY
jgi:hypothetical protein